MEFTIQEITTLAKLITEEKLDYLKIGDLEIKKSLHKSEDSKFNSSISNDDLLFAAGASNLPTEIVETFLRPRRRSSESKE